MPSPYAFRLLNDKVWQATRAEIEYEGEDVGNPPVSVFPAACEQVDSR
jgi:hypothetical protein